MPIYKKKDILDVEVRAERAEVSQGLAAIRVGKNEAPIGGTCVIKRENTDDAEHTPEPLSDFLFTVQCTNWKDPDGDGISKYVFIGTYIRN